MMKRKCMIVAVTIALTMTTATGCGNEAETEPIFLGGGTEPSAPSEESLYNTSESLLFRDTNDSDDSDGSDSAPTDPAQESNSSTADLSPEIDSIHIDPNAVFIGGKVRSVSQDSFVISRTLMEDFMVIMPEEGSPEEELVTIRCSASTVFERWTIQGGGAGITKNDAAFSDIEPGIGLEASGSFDGGEFIAEKVIIEVYQ